MELILLRHAQPQWTPNERGTSDPTLTPEGIAHAQALQDSLGSETFHSISVSPYQRAQQTAQGVFGHLPNVNWDSPEWLREIGLPDLSLQPADQIASFFRTAKERPLASWWDGIPGGESFLHFNSRIQSGLEGFLHGLGIDRLPAAKDSLQQLYSIPSHILGTRHLIVSHLGTSGLILSNLLHLELVPWVWECFALDWNAIVRIETVAIAGAHLFCLRAFNEGGHRDPSLGYIKDQQNES